MAIHLGIRRFFQWPLFWLIAASAQAAAFYFDETVLVAVREQARPSLRFLAEFLSTVLDWPPVLAFLAGAYWAVRRWGPHDYRRWVGAALVGASVCGLAGTGLRTIIGRVRPNSKLEPGWYGPWHRGQWTMGRHDYAAFPSGHTSTVAGAAGVLLLARPRWGAVALLLTVLVGWSRVYLTAHRLSDVVAATILGFAGGAWLWGRFIPTNRPQSLRVGNPGTLTE